MTTKAQRKAIVDEKITAEKARILHIMQLSDIYTITLINISLLHGKKKDFQKLKSIPTNQVQLTPQSIHWLNK